MTYKGLKSRHWTTQCLTNNSQLTAFSWLLPVEPATCQFQIKLTVEPLLSRFTSIQQFLNVFLVITILKTIWLLTPFEKLKTGRDSIIEPPLSGDPPLSDQQSKSQNKCRKEWVIQPLLSGHPLLSGQQSKSQNKCRKEWRIQPLLSLKRPPLLSERGNLLASLRSRRLEVSGRKKEL